MGIKLIINKGRVPVKIWTTDLDNRAFEQLINLSKLEIMQYPIAAMPDVHVGNGATVGTVIPTVKAIIPAAVGVDIGYGMNAIQLSLHANQLPNNLLALRIAIEEAVPVGNKQFQRSIKAKENQYEIRQMEKDLDLLLEKHPMLIKLLPQLKKTWLSQLGTLGGGNHFIEICVDEAKKVWLMLHSGSRAIGNIIGKYFIAAAKKDMGKDGYKLPDNTLAYLHEGSELFADYMYAVNWAQNYALTNRKIMMSNILTAISDLLPAFKIVGEMISCHHNYVAVEQHFEQAMYITRKGAINAEKGAMGIIPGSMGAKSYIVKGLGNPEAYNSCAHGAGRRMARGEAIRRFTREDLEAQTAGVECRKDKGVLDEIPQAYKNIDEVMQNQQDLVEIVHTLKQVVCVKG